MDMDTDARRERKERKRQRATGNVEGERYMQNATQSFAYKSLQKMGWQEGAGLGAQNGGVKHALKVKKRKEGAGLGKEVS